MKSLLITVAFAASTLAFGGSPAAAQSVPAVAAVSTVGLDLSTAAGVRALDLRILHAASALCGTPSPADARGRSKRDECRNEARAAAAVDRGRAIELARRASAVQLAERR